MASGDEGRQRFERRVRELEALGHRGSATSFEDRGATYLVEELRRCGIGAAKEAFDGYTALGSRVLIHIFVAGAGITLLWTSPLLTLLLGVVALASFIGEMSTRFTLLSRLIPASPSCNVVGRLPCREGREPRHRVVVCAHIDSQRTGLMWKGKLVKPLSRLYQKAPGPMMSPMFPVMLAFVTQPVVGLLALVWPGNSVSTALAGLLIVIYAVAGVLLAEWAVGPFVPGAADNATGAAAAIEAAERWSREPIDGVELVVLLSGCEETGALGAAAWVRTHEAEIRRTPTSFLVFDTFGYGRPRYAGREHTLAAVSLEYPRDILDACAEVAGRLGLHDAGPHTLPTFTDGVAFLARGIPGASLLTFEDGVHMPNYHQMLDTSDRMSFDIGWEAVRFGWEVLRAMAARSVSPARPDRAPPAH